MHGEYKMPGGKLIVADIEIEDHSLRKVQISGDFFLEPDTALEAINHALQGLSAHADEAAMTQAIEQGLDSQVQMYGISAQAIAVTVQRALENKS